MGFDEDIYQEIVDARIAISRVIDDSKRHSVGELANG